jgi:site-specific DNA-cytosine methylase
MAKRRSKVREDLKARGGVPRPPKARRRGTLTLADLSCGAGLASRGVIDGLNTWGFEVRVLAAVDPWDAAIRSYRANIPEAAPGALHETTTEDALVRDLVPKVDIVITGPPCIRDSTLAACRVDISDIAEQMARIKVAARELGERQGSMIAMETVGTKWASWGRNQGYRTIKVHDDRLGGFTIRNRCFLLKGIDTVPPQNPWRSSWSSALPEWSHPGVVATSDTFNTTIRSRRFRQRDQPGYAVVGSGASTLIYTRHPWEQIHRCTPEEQARLMGFPGLHLVSHLKRQRNSLVGNGWPRSYGLWLAQCIAKTLGVPGA